MRRLTMAFVKAAGIAFVTIAVACSSSVGQSMPTVTLDEPLDEYPGALINGMLLATESNGLIYFRLEADGQSFGLIFPPGFAATVGDPVALVDADGRVVAYSGAPASFGGGEYPQGLELWEPGPSIDSPWLAVVP